MTRPLIGITTDYNDRQTQYALNYGYAQSVERAGGLPVMLAYHTDPSLFPELLDRLDGLLFAGGDDLDPNLYGDDWHPMAQRVDPARQSFEVGLMRAADRQPIPTLAVCLGCQVLNVARGGTLHQFLPDVTRSDALEHRRLDDWARRHGVLVEAESLLGRTLGGTTLEINTSHKQAVRDVGRALRVVARAPDGVIEAIEDSSRPMLLGVQWHPERMPDAPEQVALFELLIRKASEHAVARHEGRSRPAAE